MTLMFHDDDRFHSVVASIGTTIAAHDVGMFARIPEIEPVVLVWMISAMVTDVLITVALVWHLVNYESKAA